MVSQHFVAGTLQLNCTSSETKRNHPFLEVNLPSCSKHFTPRIYFADTVIPVLLLSELS